MKDIFSELFGEYAAEKLAKLLPFYIGIWRNIHARKNLSKKEKVVLAIVTILAIIVAAIALIVYLHVTFDGEILLVTPTPRESVTPSPMKISLDGLEIDYPTDTPTPTITSTSTPVATATSTYTSTPGPSPTPTQTPTITPTLPPTSTPVPTSTPTPPCFGQGFYFEHPRHNQEFIYDEHPFITIRIHLSEEFRSTVESYEIRFLRNLNPGDVNSLEAWSVALSQTSIPSSGGIYRKWMSDDIQPNSFYWLSPLFVRRADNQYIPNTSCAIRIYVK